MNEDVQLDVNDIANSLLEQIVALSRENAVLKAQINALNKANEEDDKSASNTV